MANAQRRTEIIDYIFTICYTEWLYVRQISIVEEHSSFRMSSNIIKRQDVFSFLRQLMQQNPWRS